MEINEEVKINSRVYTIKSVGKTKAILECEGKTFPVSKELINSSIVEGKEDLDEELKVSLVKVTDEGLIININGTKYTYASDSYTPEDLEKKYLGIAKHSAGKAIAWLKKNSKVVNKATEAKKEC